MTRQIPSHSRKLLLTSPQVRYRTPEARQGRKGPSPYRRVRGAVGLEAALDCLIRFHVR